MSSLSLPCPLSLSLHSTQHHLLQKPLHSSINHKQKTTTKDRALQASGEGEEGKADGEVPRIYVSHAIAWLVLLTLASCPTVASVPVLARRYRAWLPIRQLREMEVRGGTRERIGERGR